MPSADQNIRGARGFLKEAWIKQSISCAGGHRNNESFYHETREGGGWHTWRLEQDLHLVKKENRWLITLAEARTY